MQKLRGVVLGERDHAGEKLSVWKPFAGRCV